MPTFHPYLERWHQELSGPALRQQCPHGSPVRTLDIAVNPLRDRQMLYGFAATPHFPLHMQCFAADRLRATDRDLVPRRRKSPISTGLPV